MSTMCQADGLSRNEIRLIAKRLRKIFNIKGYCFPIVKFLDVVLPTIDEEFSLSIVEPDEITPGHYAITYPDTHEMVVRSDVYAKDYGKKAFRFYVDPKSNKINYTI